MTNFKKLVLFSLLPLACRTVGWAQSLPSSKAIPLDVTRYIAASTPKHEPLPEQYIWTAGDVTATREDREQYPWNRADLQTAAHFFRTHFNVKTLPHAATIYVAGPREAHVYLNGHLLSDFYSNIDAPIGFHVFHADAAHALRAGDNVIAVQAVRGRGVVSGSGPDATAQIAYGEILAAKIIPAPFGVVAPALVISDTSWRSSTAAAPRWTEPNFDDDNWKPVQSLGPIESNIDFFQWSVDAGMYGWPGYMGISASLRTYPLSASAVTHVFPARSSFTHIDAITDSSVKEPFTVTRRGSQTGLVDAEAPSLMLDFGREVSGRLLVESASSTDSLLSIAYGESEIEALATGLNPGQQGGNYLGTNLLEVPANLTARGPKSGFRYVYIRFLRGAPTNAFKSIRVEGIYYPVEYKGSFESSDPLLNRIWETGAYTAHLCMQEGIWDAPKRDRGRWVGDLDVEGRVINTVFGDPKPIEETLRVLAPAGSEDVNGIPGYSALWITSLLNLYLHSGDKSFIASQHDALLRVLSIMDNSLDRNGLFTNPKHQWLFVDWSPYLYAYTPEARIGTQLQYARAYRAASTLLHELDDNSNAEKYETQQTKVLTAIHTLRDANGVTYGNTWQLNALAVIADATTNNSTVWDSVLSHVKQDAASDQIISPYFNAYLLDAMSATSHQREALDWIRTYWGGMLAEGATSFWESYDLRWPKTNPHLSLQADGTSGYFVSLAHGWSSGPTAWLAENVLGVIPTGPGYDTVDIRPNLFGLEYAKGSIPTPHGLILISIDKTNGVALDLPVGIVATINYKGASAVVKQSGHYTYPGS